MNTDLTAHERLRRRQAQLDQRAQWHIERAKGNLTYLRTNGPKMIKAELTEKVADSSPVIGKVMNFLGWNKSDRDTNIRERRAIVSQEAGGSNYSESRYVQRGGASRLSRFASAILPSLYTLGGMQLLSTSLKGAGKVVRSGFGRLLRKKRK